MSETEAPSAQATCCENFDESSKAACALCQEDICGSCQSIVNEQAVCASCLDQIKEEIAAEQGGAAQIPQAIIGGFITAIIAGIVWCTLTVVTGWQVGYVAVGVGWFVGKGILLITRGKKAGAFQVIAAASSVIGLLLGTYLIFGHFTQQMALTEGAEGLTIFDIIFSFEFIKWFVTSPGDVFDFYDLLWSAIAIGVSYKMLAPSTLVIGTTEE